MRGCKRQAYERTNNLCNNHFQETQGGTFTGEIDEQEQELSLEDQDNGDGMETEEKAER